MKTRRIWIVIVVILVAGVCSTTYTKRYVQERETSDAMQSMAETAYGYAADAAGPSEEAAKPPAADAGALGTRAGGEGAGADGAVEDAARKAALQPTGAAGEAAGSGEGLEEAAGPMPLETGEAGRPEAQEGPVPAAAAPGSAAPLSAPIPAETEAAMQEPGAAAGAPVQETAAEARADVILAGGGAGKAEVSYKARLEDLDGQIEQNRRADAEKNVANSVKARAENERKLWEAELDGILKALEERLDSAQTEDLYAEQREWRREREAKALEASRRQSGSTLEEVEYSVSLAESTRARAYELVEEYGAVLGE